jgi:hypothetical protein
MSTQRATTGFSDSMQSGTFGRTIGIRPSFSGFLFFDSTWRMR